MPLDLKVKYNKEVEIFNKKVKEIWNKNKATIHSKHAYVLMLFLMLHSRLQRPRSFGSAPPIVTS